MSPLPENVFFQRVSCHKYAEFTLELRQASPTLLPVRLTDRYPVYTYCQRHLPEDSQYVIVSGYTNAIGLAILLFNDTEQK